MKHSLSTLLLFAFLLPVLPLQAQLVWQNEDADVPANAGQTEIVADFRFVNSGTQSVTITRVRPGCGCTTAKLDKQNYAPGESGVLIVTFSPGDRVGPQEKVIQVDAQVDGAEPVHTYLKLKTNIPKPLQFDPPSAVWKKGEPLTPRRIRVTADKAVPIHDLKLDESVPELRVQVVPIEGAPGEWWVDVTPLETTTTLRAVIFFRSDWPADNPRRFSLFVAIDR